jgi:single-stranded DNA-specific DHH superfamily exonuclease
MIVYGFYYNSCIHESAAGLQSLHTNKEGAEKAMAQFVKEHLEDIEESNKWCLENEMEECVRDVSLYDWQQVFVEEIEVKE